MKKCVASNPFSELIALLGIGSKEGTITRAAPINVNHGIESLISFICCSSHATCDTAGFISLRNDPEALIAQFLLLSDLSPPWKIPRIPCDF